MEYTIDVSGIDKVAFAKAVYRLSVPQGLGIHQAVTGELDQAAAERIADAQSFEMDYVNGRACKMDLKEDNKPWKVSARLMAPDSWYDHTDDQYERLLSEFGIKRETLAKHSAACNCPKCIPKPADRYPEWEKRNAVPSN